MSKITLDMNTLFDLYIMHGLTCEQTVEQFVPAIVNEFEQFVKEIKYPHKIKMELDGQIIYSVYYEDGKHEYTDEDGNEIQFTSPDQSDDN